MDPMGYWSIFPNYWKSAGRKNKQVWFYTPRKTSIWGNGTSTYTWFILEGFPVLKKLGWPQLRLISMYIYIYIMYWPQEQIHKEGFRPTFATKNEPNVFHIYNFTVMPVVPGSPKNFGTFQPRFSQPANHWQTYRWWKKSCTTWDV